MTKYLDDVDPVGKGPAYRPEHGPGPVPEPKSEVASLADQVAALTRVVERLEARRRR